MAEFSSPILGGIRVARSTVSSSVFGGNPRASASSGPDPTTISILSRNELALTSVSNQIAGMSQQIMSLSVSLQQIGTSIANDSALDRQRELQKQNQERILAQQQLREGKESIIEKKMQNALISPVTKIAAKAKFTLDKVGKFFTILLGGWIANQSIQAIQALITRNKKRLEEIKNNVIKNLGVVGGILLAVNGGLSTLAKIASKFAIKISSIAVKGLFINPVKALINAVKDAGKGLLGLGKNGTPAATATATRSASSGPGGFFGGLMDGAGGILKGLAKRAVPFGVGAAIDIAGGEDPARAAAGAAAGVGGAEIGGIIGAPFGPLGILGGSIAGYMITEPLGKSLYDNATGKTPKTTTTPTTTKTPEISKISGKKEDKSQDLSQQPSVSLNVSPVAGESGADSQAAGVTPQGQSTDYSSVFSGQSQIQPFKSQESQQKMQSVGPLPEPQPTVVMAPSPPTPVQSAPSGGGGGPANSVPAISSSNPDNFYVLYSQAHYNVVI